jgi:hypothetical protein
MLWLLLPPGCESNTDNAAYITQALAVPQPIFKPKRSGCRPRTRFRNGMTIQSAPPPQAGTFYGGEGVTTIWQPPYLPNISSADIFCFGEVKSELTDLSLSQGGLMTRLEGALHP